jgi:hypothetical protein
MDILRKEYCTRRGSALEVFRTRAKSRGRPVTSDRPPPRRFGQAAWTAAGRPIFCYRGGGSVYLMCVSVHVGLLKGTFYSIYPAARRAGRRAAKPLREPSLPLAEAWRTAVWRTCCSPRNKHLCVRYRGLAVRRHRPCYARRRPLLFYHE